MPGDEVGGYRLLRRIGAGGQGTVHLAESPTGERVALKLLLPELVRDPAARRRVLAEAEAARRVPSFCTARLLAVDVDGDQPYLVTEYVPGPSLAEAVRERGVLTGSELERLMVGTLTALVTIHRAGVVHHDLKPANILLGPDGPRVVDFGVALRTGAVDPDTGADDGVLGTAAFLAPERLDAGPATPASDVFAWAATMVHAATARSPFRAADVAAVVAAVRHRPPQLDGVPGTVRPLLLACLAKDPARRPTAQQALDRLLEALQPADTEPGVGAATAAEAGAGSGVPAWGTRDLAAAGPAPGTSSAPAQLWIPRDPVPPRPSERRLRATRRLIGTAVGLVGLLAVLLTRGGPAAPVGSADPVPAEGGAPVTRFVEPTLAFDGSTVTTVMDSGDVLHLSVSAGGGVGDGDGDGAGLDLFGTAEVADVALSGDGRTAAVVVRDRTEVGGDRTTSLRVHDLRTGVTVLDRKLSQPATDAADVAVSRDGSVVAAAVPADDTSGSIEIYITSGAHPRRELSAPHLVQGTLSLSPDGRWLAYGHDAGVARTAVVDLAAAAPTPVDLPVACSGEAALRADGLAVCRADGRLVSMSRGGRVLLDLVVDDSPGLVSLSPDGRAVATTAEHGGLVRVVALDGAGTVDRAVSRFAGPGEARIAWSPDAKRLAVAYDTHDRAVEVVTVTP